MSQDIRVRWVVTSRELDPEEIAVRLGLPAEFAWRIGELRPHTIIRETNHGWTVGSGLNRSAALECHVEALLRILEPRAVHLKDMADQVAVMLSCVIYAESPPALNFEPDVIRRLAGLGASLDIDLYIIPDDSSL